MILLDTNVVSEFRKIIAGKGDAHVASWAVQQSAPSLFLAAITLHELEKGVLLMERRDRRQGAELRTWLDGSLMPAFAGRILPVDERVALAAAHLHIPNPRPLADCLIAATAVVHGMTIATRNTGDFQGLPVALVNPWLA
jgi:predicted nucleic acid-binding protein